MESHPMTMSGKSETADEVRIKAAEDFHGAMDDVDSEKNPDKYEDQKSPMNSEVYDLKISQSNKDVCSPMRCRLCAIPNNVMVDIFSSHSITQNMVEKIGYCLCILVEESDPLPNQVCWLCLGKLEMCYDFNQAVAEAESQLLAYCQQTTDDKIEETDPSRCGVQHDATEYDRIEGTLENCSDLDIDYESTTFPEKVEPTNITMRSSLALACLKPCSVAVVPTDIHTRNNINNDEKGSSSDDELLDKDSSADVSNSAKTLVSQNDSQSTCKLAQAKSDSESEATEKFLSTHGGTEIEDTKNGSSNDPAEIGQPRHNIAKRKCHRRSHVVDRKYKCSVCGKKFFTKANRDRHHLIHTKEKRVELASRPKISEMISGIHHENGFENMKKSPTDASALRSEKKVDQRADLLVHDQVHTGNQRYECTWCAKVFTSQKNLKLHIKIHTTTAAHACEYFGKTYTSRMGINRHRLSHTEKRRFECTICKMTFVSPSRLREHALVHSNERNYACSVCDKSFKTRSNRKNHMLVHSNERPWECDYCQKKFKSKQSLQRHMEAHHNLHTGEGLTCEYCEKKFATKRDLDRHHRTHTGERPFKCPTCHKTFTCSTSSKRHALVHSEVKSYSCSLCNESFKTLGRRNRHRLVHSN